MPNIKSAAKRARTSEVKRIKNKGIMTLVSTLRNDLYSAITTGDAAKSQELFRKYCSITDKAVKKGTFRKNVADRRKSRAARRMATLK